MKLIERCNVSVNKTASRRLMQNSRATAVGFVTFIILNICALLLIAKARVKLKIIGKKLLSLKPVVRTRRSYKIAGLIKRQKSFQRLAMYGHEVMTSLQKRAKLFGIHFSNEVTVKSCCVFVRKP
jgi:hypothetical protein